MKRIFTIMCAALVTLSTVKAESLLNEHFDRALGTLSASTWSGGTLPNDSNWHTYSPGTVQFQVVNQQLQYADYCSAGTGKAVQYTANHSRDYILFPQAFNGAAGSKVYMAFLLKANGLQTTSSAQSATNANNSILSFAINASNNALGSLNGRVIIQTVDEGSYKLGVSRRGETPQFAGQVMNTGTTYLVVAEYCFIEGEKNDIVNLYINPTPSAQTVAVASVNPSTASADTDVLVGAALCSNGNTPTNMLLDEIRVATSWDDLWEDSSAPTPAIHVAGTFDFGQVTVGEAAERTITVKGSNLKGAISVSSDQSVLVPAVSSIAAGDAEAEGGYALKMTLTAGKEGAGSANLTLSSGGASDQIVVVNWNAKKPVPPMGSELLQNGSFEEYSCNPMFGCSFDDWNMPLGSATANSDDKLDGDVSISFKPTQAANLDQGVTLSGAEYADGTLFKVTMHYKVLSLPAGGSLDVDCYWEPAGGGDAEAMKLHDADKLQKPIATEATSGWETFTAVTSKPANSTYFRVRMKIPKNAEVLLDQFSLVQTEDTEPYILVTPSTLKAVETTLGNTAVFETIRVKQGHLTSETTFRIGGTDASHFQLSATSMPADQSEMNIVVTYAPQAAGTHRASLIFDNVNHTAILPDMITLNGTCTDPSAKPEISVTPSIVPAFEVNVGQQTTQTISVTSINCTDYVYMRVDHITGAAFTIDGTMLPKNATSDVTIRFTPLEAGTYQSTLTIYSENAQSVVVTLNGTGRNPSPETVDWQVDFQWDMSHPLAVLDEHFDGAEHNKTLLVDGWQNVAKATARPWWGFDEAKTTPVRGEGKYAKATAYQYAKDSTDTWEMWLVTPALDYKNAPSQVFAFSVKGEYLPEEGNKALFELYFIDANDPAHVFFQAFDGLSIPKTSDEDGVWVPFQIHLENQANIPDVFHMAFRYVSPNGNEGVVTYYVDDVSWGVVAEGVRSETQAGPAVRSEKILRDGQIVIRKNGIEYNVLGIPMQ